MTDVSAPNTTQSCKEGELLPLDEIINEDLVVWQTAQNIIDGEGDTLDNMHDLAQHVLDMRKYLMNTRTAPVPQATHAGNDGTPEGVEGLLKEARDLLGDLVTEYDGGGLNGWHPTEEQKAEHPTAENAWIQDARNCMNKIDAAIAKTEATASCRSERETT